MDAHYTTVRSPKSIQHGRNTSVEMTSIISKLGDPKKNSDRLKLSLLKIRFPQSYNEKEAMDGHPTQYMKIINYTLFVASGSVKNYLIEKGVDPDTVYLNDLKFMKKVFHILVSIFGYKPCITIDQFFKYGFPEQKMILCCDTINLVRQAARDLKIKKSISRKRSETNRASQVGRFSVLNHSKDQQKDFVYERDTVNKVAKVSKLDDKLQQSREAQRVEQRDSIQNARFGASGVLRNRSRSSSRYSLTQSRYKLPQNEVPNCHHGCNEEHEHQQRKMSSSVGFQPLRTKVQTQEIKEQIRPLTAQPASRQPVAAQVPAAQDQQNQLLMMLKNTIDQLNNRFEHFERTVDKKIDSIHNDFEDLNTKFQTLSVQKDDRFMSTIHKQDHTIQVAGGGTELKERGAFASPYHYSEFGGQVNPLKEFTFDKDQAMKQLYHTDGFKGTQKEDLRDESRQLIDNIRKNLDESKEMLSKHIPSQQHGREQDDDNNTTIN